MNRKLTKEIKRRRKNYKPTIGIILENGKRASVNAVIYFDMLRKQEEAELEAEIYQELHNIIREHAPGLAALEDYLGSMGSWMYY